jgi:hypothetical protein
MWMPLALFWLCSRRVMGILICPASTLRCSGLMKPDTHLGENARHREVSDDQATSYLYP